MFPSKALFLFCLGLFLCPVSFAAVGLRTPAMEFPLPVDSYHDQQIPSILRKLAGRIQQEPLNLAATIIFLAAIIHTFLTAQFRRIAHRYQRRYEAIEDLHQGCRFLPGSTDHSRRVPAMVDSPCSRDLE